ncbi:collagen alpha-1(III) chain-like [Perognathus longimembris pacificus]|uniref:collagen alpha-1(III) chain-like n=1 Tax=Perognathus longimembris pacificus TaxID=214514 RepID=UPI0020194F1C|nr:collagen alpha-1(III) chain-like [Perognathus longimembris pacificus]
MGNSTDSDLQEFGVQVNGSASAPSGHNSDFTCNRFGQKEKGRDECLASGRPCGLQPDPPGWKLCAAPGLLVIVTPSDSQPSAKHASRAQEESPGPRLHPASPSLNGSGDRVLPMPREHPHSPREIEENCTPPPPDTGLYPHHATERQARGTLPEPGDTRSPCDQPGDTERPCDQPGDTQSPCDQPGDTRSPCDQPGDTRSPCDQPGDTRSPCDQPGDTRSPCDQLGDTERPCDQPGDTQSPCDQPGDTERPCDQPGDTERPCDQSGDTRSPCDQPGDTRSPCDQPGDTRSPCDQPGDTERPCDQPGDTQSPCDQPGDTERPCDQPGDTNPSKRISANFPLKSGVITVQRRACPLPASKFKHRLAALWRTWLPPGTSTCLPPKEPGGRERCPRGRGGRGHRGGPALLAPRTRAHARRAARRARRGGSEPGPRSCGAPTAKRPLGARGHPESNPAAPAARPRPLEPPAPPLEPRLHSLRPAERPGLPTPQGPNSAGLSSSRPGEERGPGGRGLRSPGSPAGAGSGPPAPRRARAPVPRLPGGRGLRSPGSPAGGSVLGWKRSLRQPGPGPRSRQQPPSALRRALGTALPGSLASPAVAAPRRPSQVSPPPHPPPPSFLGGLGHRGRRLGPGQKAAWKWTRPAPGEPPPPDTAHPRLPLERLRGAAAQTAQQEPGAPRSQWALRARESRGPRRGEHARPVRRRPRRPRPPPAPLWPAPPSPRPWSSRVGRERGPGRTDRRAHARGGETGRRTRSAWRSEVRACPVVPPRRGRVHARARRGLFSSGPPTSGAFPGGGRGRSGEVWGEVGGASRASAARKRRERGGAAATLPRRLPIRSRRGPASSPRAIGCSAQGAGPTAGWGGLGAGGEEGAGGP